MRKMEFEGLFKTCYMCSIRNRTTLQINAAFFFFLKESSVIKYGNWMQMLEFGLASGE